MSEDTGSATHSESESTIEAVEIDGVLRILEQAVEDAVELKDWLLYSTVLDYYLGDREKYTSREQEQLLTWLVDSLSKHKELVYNAGWDIPSILIEYINQDRDDITPLRSLPCLLQVMQAFELLALHGNHKELLLKACELLSAIKFDDNVHVESDEAKEAYYQLKLHCLIELIDTSVRKINTLYPSRFLAMAIASFFNVLDYVISRPSSRVFLVKRVYSFARDYNTPTLTSFPDTTAEDLKKINEDEAYLQRKLLRGFFTQFIGTITSVSSFDFSGDYLTHLASGSDKEASWLRAHSSYSVYSRSCELVLSFDIDLKAKFAEFLTSSHALFHGFDFKESQDELTAKVYRALLKDRETSQSNAMLDTTGEKIKDSVDGCLMVYTFLHCSRNSTDDISLTFNDALVSTLRLVVPGMLSPAYVKNGLQDMVVFWSWLAVHKLQLAGKSLQLEISTISSVLLKMYFQCLLFIAYSQWRDSDIRSAALTLFTKLLTHTHQDIAYDFIHDTLENFPHELIKGAVVGVLKELMTKERSSASADDIDLSKIDLGDKKGPQVPPREKSASNKYVDITDNRIADILTLVDATVDRTIVDNHLNQESYGTLVAYLNLLISLKRNLQDVPQFKKVVTKTAKLLEGAEKEVGDEKEPQGLTERNAVGILRVSLDRLNV